LRDRVQPDGNSGPHHQPGLGYSSAVEFNRRQPKSFEHRRVVAGVIGCPICDGVVFCGICVSAKRLRGRGWSSLVCLIGLVCNANVRLRRSWKRIPSPKAVWYALISLTVVQSLIGLGNLVRQIRGAFLGVVAQQDSIASDYCLLRCIGGRDVDVDDQRLTMSVAYRCVPFATANSRRTIGNSMAGAIT